MLKDGKPKKAEQPARLVSYAPDGSTCTLNIDGEEVYFNREQQAQEPVACSNKYGCKCDKHYTHPAPSWQGLSDDEIREEIDWAVSSDNGVTRIIEFARAIENTLKEKNHG